MTKTFKEIIAGIRTAIFGREVREDIAQGMEYVEQFAKTCIAKAQEAAQSAAQALQALKDTLAAKTEAVQAISTEKQTGLDAISTAKSDAVKETQDAHTAALQDISDARTGALNDVANSTKTATEAASTATQKAGEASTSAADAEQAKTDAEAAAAAAGKSRTGAETAQKNAEAAAALAGTRASTDKTLAVENAPADAAATGKALAQKANKDVILDEDGNVIFYSKAAVDELLAKKLDLTGGTLNGDLFLESDYGKCLIGWGEGDGVFRIHDLAQGTSIFAEDTKTGNVYYAGNKIFFNGKEDPYVVASGSNYVRFGDGTQICWGDTPAYPSIAPRTTSTQTVTFQVPFINASYGIEAGPTYDGGNTWMLHTFNLYRAASYATIGLSNGSTSDTVNAGTIYSYIAIGRWK